MMKQDLGDAAEAAALRPFGLSPYGSQAKPAAAIAWLEAAACLSKCDFAGFDSAMRIFRNLTSREAGSSNKQPASNQ